MKFKDDPKDRKRRFLRGLNYLIGLSYENLEDNVSIKESLEMSGVGIPEFRNRLASTYCLSYTPKEMENMLSQGITTSEFTEEAVKKIYGDRGNVDFNRLQSNSAKNIEGKLVIDLSKMDEAPKFGRNGGDWCDVAEGPCSCAAWHN